MVELSSPASPAKVSEPSTDSDAPAKRPPTPAKDLDYPSPPAKVHESGGAPMDNGGVKQHRKTTSKTFDLADHPPAQKVSNPNRDLEAANTTNVPDTSASDPDDPNALPWNPEHPCYPHPNSHVPQTSPLQSRTRIIRISRDWMIAGDLAPTFSNTYPEILDPWVSEAMFRQLVQGVNERSLATFSPFGAGKWRMALDLVMGVITGWIWDDLGLTGAKTGVKDLETFLEEWNGRVHKDNMMLSGNSNGAGAAAHEKDEEADLVKAISLRRTGFLSLDIQIPDPKIGLVGEPSRQGSMAAPGEEGMGAKDVDELSTEQR